MPSKHNQLLLVEGNNDKHVVWTLCELHNVNQTFEVKAPGDAGLDSDGISELIKGIPVQLKEPDLIGLGILVDADEYLHKRWESLITKLRNTEWNYNDLPQNPCENGFVGKYEDKPNLGIWLMPDNNINGRIEDFASFLIPQDDGLVPFTRDYIQAVEDNSLNKYKDIHTSKAFIHAWLACQKIPGVPLGQAIKIKALLHDAEIANRFIAWLNKLFN